MMRWLLVLLALACVESHAQPTMAGTPTSITWGSGATPAGQPVTVTGDACYFTWTHYAGSGDGTASVTLGGNSPDTFFEIVRDQFESDGAATGVAAWYAGAGLPSAGTQTLVPVWDGSPSEGPTSYFLCSSGGGQIRDVDADHERNTETATVTIDTTIGDLVIRHDQCFCGTPPDLISGWTDLGTHTNNSESSRLSYLTAASTSQTCAVEGEPYASVLCFSIPEAEAAEPEPPVIYSVTPDEFEDEDTGIVIAGAHFGETEGVVLICPTDDVEDMGCEAQTVTAWADDEITFTAVLGGLTEDQTSYLFVVTDDALANAAGAEVTFLAPIVATKLIFASQPGNIIVGQTFGAFSVRAVDDDEQLDETYSSEVTLTLCMGEGTLGGTTAKNATGGIATFDDVFLNTLNEGAVMCAGDGVLTQAESDPFDATVGGEGEAVGMPATSTLGGALQR